MHSSLSLPYWFYVYMDPPLLSYLALDLLSGCLLTGDSPSLKVAVFLFRALLPLPPLRAAMLCHLIRSLHGKE